MIERARPVMESAWKTRLKRERDVDAYKSLPLVVKRYLLTSAALSRVELSPRSKARVIDLQTMARKEIEKSPELIAELAGYIERRKEIQEQNRRSESKQYTGWGTVVKEVKKKT